MPKTIAHTMCEKIPSKVIKISNGNEPHLQSRRSSPSAVLEPRTARSAGPVFFKIAGSSVCGKTVGYLIHGRGTSDILFTAEVPLVLKLSFQFAHRQLATYSRLPLVLKPSFQFADR